MPEQPDSPQPKRRFADFFRRRQAGDSVAASVQNSQNVTVGKNIVQIGTLVVPVLPLVALLVLAVSSAGAWVWQQNSGPTTMADGSYNIAVVDFADKDKARGQRLSTWIGQSLERENANNASGSANTLIWYDELPGTQKSTKLGVIDGATVAARRTQAESLAQRIHAKIVIYGVVSADNALTPEFYVANQSSDEADWISGVQQLGDRPVYVDGPTDGVEADLSARARTLWLLTRALSSSSRGDSSQAYVMLQQATATADPLQSREILLNCRGAAALFLAQKIWRIDSDAFARYVSDAETSFQDALAVKPTYIRAIIGLGSVAKARAEYLLNTTAMTTTHDQVEQLLGEAIAQYTTAQQLAPTAYDRAWSEVIPTSALGSAYRSRGDMFAALAFDARAADDAAASSFAAQAEMDIDQAIANLQPGIAPLQHQAEWRLLGQSYLSLGNAMSQKANLRGLANDSDGRSSWAQQASSTYQACIDLATAPIARDDRILTEQVVGLCRKYKQNSDQVSVTKE